MAVFTSARFGTTYNYNNGDNGWGASVNRVLAMLDVIVDPVLLSTTLTTAPTSPNNGDAYFVGTAAATSGNPWAGQANVLASYQNGSWNFYPCPTGFRAFVTGAGSTPNQFMYWSGTNWVPEVNSASGAVSSVAGRTGAIVLSVADVAGAAPVNNPSFTGNPSAPTQAANDNSLKLATTGYVDRAVTGLSAPVSSVNGQTGAITGLEVTSNKGAANGYAALDSTGKVPAAQLPASSGGSQPYDMASFFPGSPAASVIVFRYTASRPVTLAQALAGSVGSAGTAAAASAVFTVQAAQGSSAPDTFTVLGSMTYAAGAVKPTFATASQLVLAAGDVLEVIAPGTPDTTLANISTTLVGTR